MTTFDYALYFQSLLSRRLQQIGQSAKQELFVKSASMQAQALQAFTYVFASNLQAPQVLLGLLNDLTPLMEQVGHREQWNTFLVQGCKLAQQLRDSKLEAALSFHVGVLWHRQSSYEKAKQWLDRSLYCYEKMDDDHGRAKVLYQRAHIASLQYEFDHATQLVEQADCFAGTDAVLQAMGYFIKGVIAAQRRDWHGAEQMHCKALALRKASKDQRRVAWSLLDLANVYHRQQQYEKAIRSCQESATILRSLSDNFSWARVQITLGGLYLDQDDAACALASFQQAIHWLKASNELLYSAKLYTNMGLAFLKLGQPQAAEQSFRQSASLFRILQDWSLELNARDGLAMALIAQGHYSAAIANLQEGLADLRLIAHLPSYGYLSESMNKHLAQAQHLIPDEAMPIP